MSGRASKVSAELAHEARTARRERDVANRERLAALTARDEAIERASKAEHENAELAKMLGAHQRGAEGNLLVPCLACAKPTGEWCTTCWGAVCVDCRDTHDAGCQTELVRLRAEREKSEPRVKAELDAAYAAMVKAGAERDEAQRSVSALLRYARACPRCRNLVAPTPKEETPM